MNQRKLRALRFVRRFNFEQCINYQSVAEHSYFVALLALELAKFLGMPAAERAEAVEAALLHDAAEAATGDIPYLVRRKMDRAFLVQLEHDANGEVGIDPSYGRDVLMVVNFVDALELAMYLKEERRSGNTALLDIESETRFRLQGERPSWYEFAMGVLGEDIDRPEVEPSGGITDELKH